MNPWYLFYLYSLIFTPHHYHAPRYDSGEAYYVAPVHQQAPTWTAPVIAPIPGWCFKQSPTVSVCAN